ncbi:hypothetical protein EBI_27539, partial [Enterocytozoon bieneusi H348]
SDDSDPRLPGIEKLTEANSTVRANELLAEGWVLLGMYDRRDGNDEYVLYVLGFPGEPAAGFFG